MRIFVNISQFAVEYFLMPYQITSDSETFNKMNDYLDKQFDEMRDEFKEPEKKGNTEEKLKKNLVKFSLTLTKSSFNRFKKHSNTLVF